jgi:hypothetical protein
MRLIDADALIGTIEKYKFGAISSESEREYTREIMLCFVNGSPTAYDVEKVVECIHDFFVQKIDDCEEDIVPHEILEYNKAICKIVRKGGVE